MKLSRAQRDRLRKICDEQPAFVMPAANVLALLDAADEGDDARAQLEHGAALRIEELEAELARALEGIRQGEAAAAEAGAELARLRRVARAAGRLSDALQEARAIADIHDPWRTLDEALEAWRPAAAQPAQPVEVAA